MAQIDDESNTQALPDPELNPLLNPLLAANMGRWAEVYFTSPPEKRAQAVSELVRELAAKSTGPVSTPGSGESSQQSVTDEGAVPAKEEYLASPAEPPLVCGACGHRNSEAQRFCVMCGSPLPGSPEHSSPPFVEEKALAAAAWAKPAGRFPTAYDRAAAETDSGRSTENGELPEDIGPRFADESPVPFEVLSNYQSEPVSGGYRVYVGIVLAVLLGLLVYMTWRGNSALWSSGRTSSGLPRAVPTPAEPEPAPATEPSAAKAAAPNPKANVSRAASASPARAPEQPTGSEEKNRAGTAEPESTRPALRVVPVAASSATNAAENGSEELAIAERYLSAGPGSPRDTRQASSWLWKAVAKQNVNATVLLADLYLRGDGVAKSCDQARLLLDAAARKGGRAAGERLRNLQAFGCP